MDPSSSSSFTSLLNSSASSPEFHGPPSSYNHHFQSFPPPYFPRNLRPPPPYGPNQQTQYPHHFNPFGVQPGYHQFRATSSSYYGIPLHDDVGQYLPGGFIFGMEADPSSPVGSAALCGGVDGSGSRGDESASPGFVPHAIHGVPVIEEHSESSPEEENHNSRRRIWSEEENLRLVSAWLNNSIDHVQGVDKKYDHYWKDVAKDYNKHSPKEQKRTAAQLKTHWNRYAPVVNKFNQCWNRMKSAHGSGESDDQIMERAHATFKSENSQKPFLLEYWWRVVKDQPKWGRVHQLESKRTKLNLAGAYTSSSNQDTDEAHTSVNRRPTGQKKAKANLKGKGKASSQASEGYLSNETVSFFNDFQLRKTEAIEKMADATSEHAKALAEQAAAKKEKAKADKIEKYLKLMTIDISNFSDEQKARHERVVNRLTKELFPEDDH